MLSSCFKAPRGSFSSLAGFGGAKMAGVRTWERIKFSGPLKSDQSRPGVLGMR